MTTISQDDVARVAQLSGLTLSDEERERYQQEFSEIINYFDKLDAFDLDGIEPTYQVTGLQNVSRPDTVIDYGVTREELLKNSPAQQDGQIKVGKVL